MKENTSGRWVALACAWILVFFAYASVLCVSPILGRIIPALELTHTQAGILYSAPIITLAALAIPGGILADKIGVRKTAGIGATILGISAFLRGVPADFPILFMLNLMVGVGWGLEFPNLPKLVGSWFPSRSVGTATGMYSTGVFVGGALALAITIPLILPIFGDWRGVFYIWGIMSIIAAGVWWALAREPSNEQTTSSISPPKRSSEVSFRTLLKNKHIWIVAIVFCLSANVTFYTMGAWFPSFFVKKGVTEGIAALMMASTMMVGLPVSFLIPFISDKVGLRKPFIWICCLIGAVAFLIIIYTPPTFDWILVGVLGATITSTFVMGLIMPLDLVETKHVGMASGIVISVGYAGAALGPLLAGYFIDVSGTFVYSLIMLAIVMLISMGLVFTMPETGWKGKYRRS